ncbi:MAG: hypothetical protein ACI8RA_002878 [Chlamydiales bacterium]|jgi:hypothetical protein
MFIVDYLKSSIERPDYSLLQGSERIAALGKANFFSRCIRYICPKEAKKQDLKLAELVYQRLKDADVVDLKESFTDAKIFINSHQGVLTRLDDLFYAHKVQTALGVEISRLLEVDSDGKKGLLCFLRKNHLQRVIPKANVRDTKTAIVFDKKRAYIRCNENGQDFLNCRSKIKLILSRIGSSHPDYVSLQRLSDLFELSNKSELDSACLEEIGQLRKELHKHNYSYIPVDKLPLFKTGYLSNKRFLIQGIEECRVKNWKGQLKASHLEKSDDETYEFRVVTRLPSYANEKGMRFLSSFFSHVMAFMRKGHGHSWIEIAKPIYSEDGDFTGQKEIITVGYFLSNGTKSPDPAIYAPVPNKKVEKYAITEKAYETSVKYVNYVNKMANESNHKWTAIPEGSDLTCSDVKKITRVYKSMIKGTCMNFTTELKNQVLGLDHDPRGVFRRSLFPQKFIRFLDKFDRIFEKNSYLKKAVSPFSFLIRVQLPCNVA